MSFSDGLPKLIETVEVVARSIETALSLLQKIQATIPVPTLEEVAEIREGKRPLTPEAYLHGILHRTILAGENLGSDLSAVDEETLGKVHELQLSELELNAIEQAITERRKDS